MIIADKLTILNEDGDVKKEDVVYNRGSKGLGYKQVTLTGIDSVMQAVDLVETDKGTLEIQPIQNAGTNCVYIGDQIGVVVGSEIKFDLLFLDDVFYMKLTTGMINVGTPDYELLFYSNLTEKDQRIAESNKELNYVWVTYRDLFETANSLIKDEVTTFETMHTVRVTVSDVTTYKFEGRKDLSNGMLAERQRLEELRISNKRAEQEMRREQRRIEIDKRKVAEHNQNVKYEASVGLEINSMFQKLLGK